LHFKIDASAAVIMSVNNSLVCAGLEKYCNEEQKINILFLQRRSNGAVYQSRKLVLMLLRKKTTAIDKEIIIY
jgi:hypothetical protein